MNTPKPLKDPRPLTVRLVEIGEEWADLNAAAELLEETKSSLLSSIMMENGELPAWKAEAMARSDARYKNHISDMVEARRKANKARVRYDGGKAYIELARSAESTRRAEMGLR